MTTHVHVWVRSEERSSESVTVWDCYACPLVREELRPEGIMIVHEDDLDYEGQFGDEQ